MERRLAAILAADVVGYTALMGQDEAGTLRRLTHLREKVLEPLVAGHHGRIFKLMGDGLLVEFASVVDAVECAVEWQRAAADHEDGSTAPPLQFRIGINVGDVIIEDDDVYGDGVNIAARLEGIAEPGGISVSEYAYLQTRSKTSATFEDTGEHQLKNVEEPLRVFRVVDVQSASSFEHASSDGGHNKPSIAVLPFSNMSGDPEQEYFSDESPRTSSPSSRGSRDSW